MKVTLCAIGALILLSSMTGIFNNLVVVDTSAQPFEKEDRNEKIENNYNYEETTSYHNDMYKGYEEQNPNEYSSYDNYDRADYGKPYDSSYNNNDGYAADTKTSYNTMDDKYSKSPTTDNKYECQRGPFEGFFVSSVEFCDIKIHDDRKDFKKIDYDKKDPKDTKFTCPDSGLVVDKKENCPIICPPGSALEGHLVKAGSVIAEACSVDTPLQQTCGDQTDLPGVLVRTAPDDCNINFDRCAFDTNLGEALGLEETEFVEVADEQLCALEIPEVTTPPVATNPQAQCIKCADLAVFAGLNDINPPGTEPESFPQQEASADLRAAAGVFTICQETGTDRQDAFDTQVDITNTAQETLIESAFDSCLDDAPQPPTVLQTQSSIASSQENSLTTNIKSEAEIPSANTEPQNANLTSLQENPNVKALLQNPDLDSLLENPDVNALLENPDVKALLNDPEVNALLETQK